MTPPRPGGRRLVLLRHAKTEPPGEHPDELRSLTLAGRRRSAEVGAHLARTGLVPEHVLVSSAVRTRQTWEVLRAALGDVPEAEVDVTDRLYAAHPSDVLDLVRAVDGRVATLLVVGHEPTMSTTAALLAEEGSSAEVLRAGLGAGLPTGGYAVLEVDDWDVGRGTARLLDVVRLG